MLVREELAAALVRAVAQARAAGDLPPGDTPPVLLDVPPSPELGDFSSDLAIALSRLTRQPAAQIADILARRLDQTPHPLVEQVQAGSGFLNFRLRPGWALQAVEEAVSQGPEYGKNLDLGEGASLLLEFVSAHPTGPLTVSHGRGAAFGDALAGLLAWSGYQVHREFYVNDAGTHTRRLGTAQMAEVLAHQRGTLDRFGIRFDTWFHESELHQSGKVDRVLDQLREQGRAYEDEGALWLRSTAFGDTDDRPLLRSNGNATYLAADLAYHVHKFERGFAHAIDVWPADHQDYVGRTRSGIRALGRDPAAVEILIFQPVTLKIDGILVESSGPLGNTRLLAEVIERVGKDTARLLYLARPAGSPLELDLDLAIDPDSNPLQQIAGAVTRARSAGISAGDSDGDEEGQSSRAAQSLVRRVADFPDELRQAARERDPSRMVRFARETASALDACREVGPNSVARRRLLAAGEIVVQNALAVLGIALP